MAMTARHVSGWGKESEQTQAEIQLPGSLHFLLFFYSELMS